MIKFYERRQKKVDNYLDGISSILNISRESL